MSRDGTGNRTGPATGSDGAVVTTRNRLIEGMLKLKVQIQGCIREDAIEIEQAVENALSNLIALVESGDIGSDGPEDIAQVAGQMIRASMDRMGIEGVVGLSVSIMDMG